MRPIEDPITTPEGPNDFADTRSTHPAFGQIIVHRVTGGAVLYGSDFAHNNFMRVTISRSQLRRGLSHDSHFPTDELIAVDLSEAQWASFVSSPNSGTGTPCTISHVGGNRMAGLPTPADRGKQFAGELDGKLKGSIDALSTLLARMDEMGLPKGKTAELRDALETALREMTANLPFVAKSFGKHVEKTVEKAKAEIHGYMNSVVARAGFEALRGERPLQIEGHAPSGENER